MAAALLRVRRYALPAGFALTALALSITAAHADDVTDLGSVGTSAQGGGTAAPVSPAAAAAPATATLKATEPQSIISKSFIEDAKPADTDYTAIAAIAPSVAGGLTTNGPGLGDTGKNTIRGFQDGQYNITWDGIPFGDTNGPTHHSTAYFPGQVIGRVDVERGPGNASDIGQATFGGSLNLFSQDISNTEVISPYYSLGSWDTQLKGARVQTGTLDSLGGAKASFTYQNLSSDGYLTNSPVRNQTLALKAQKPLGDSTVITVDINHGATVSFLPDAGAGLTMAQAQQYGKNFQLSQDPTQGNFAGYNYADKSTDMDYVRLQSDLGNGWGVDNTLYYYNYVNDTFAASNVTPGADFEATKASKCQTEAGVAITNCIPAYEKINKYWVSGDIFKSTKQFNDSDLLRMGLWVEHSETFRARFTYDAVNGQTNYAPQSPPSTGANIGWNDTKYDQQGAWNNYQPFVEYEWKPLTGLTITPGFKYVNTLVNVNAEINQTSREAQNLDKLFTAKLPYLTANYRFNDQWSSYAQYAQGMVVPDLSAYQTDNAGEISIQPQKSTNYQLGVVHQSKNLAFDADVYEVKLSNLILTGIGADPSEPFEYNGGTGTYKGVEGEVSYIITTGLSVFANGSVNHAVASSTNGAQIAGAPINTAALGSIYKYQNWSAAYVYKHVGDQYNAYATPTELYKMNGYNSTDVTVGYTFNPESKVRKVKLQFGIYNLQNRQTILSVTPAGGAAAPSAADTYTFQAPRSYMGSVVMDL